MNFGFIPLVGFRRPVLLPLLALGIFLPSRLSAQKAGAIILKRHYYTQTGAASYADDPTQGQGAGATGAVASPGAFAFNALFNASGSVTVPGGMVDALSANSNGNNYGLPTNGYSTQSALDAAFPNGSYTLTTGGKSYVESLTGNLYPNVPLVTVSQGTWSSNGTLVIDPTQPLTITVSFTTNYVSGQSLIELDVSGVSTSYDSSSSSGTGFNESQLSTMIPANTLTGGGTLYQISSSALTATAVPDQTSISGYVIAALYGTNVTALLQAGQGTPPSFTSQPQNQTVNVGAMTSFSAQVSGTQPLTYQWYLNGVAIAGATQLGYNITSATLAQAGTYTVTATGTGGTATSNGATLTVNGTAAPEITYSPYTFSTLVGSAGSPTFVGDVDGTGSAAQLQSPVGVALDGSGNLFVTDFSAVRKVTQSGVATTIASSYTSTGFPPPLNAPAGVAVDAAGNVYFTNPIQGTISIIRPGGLATVYAGTGAFLNEGDHVVDGPAALASFAQPQSVAVDSSGRIYVADGYSNSIRVITPGASPTVSTLAGSGIAGYQGAGSTDGPIASARFFSPAGVAVDGAGNIYVADSGNNTVRKISGGFVTTLAGLAGSSGWVDGNGLAARFHTGNFPVNIQSGGFVGNFVGIAVDQEGSNVYLADLGNQAVRKISSGGTVTTIAASGNSPNFMGTTATGFSDVTPQGLAVDGSGNLYVVNASANGSQNGTVLVGSQPAAPTITTQPLSQTAKAGSSVTLTVVASGSGLTYQWNFNGLPISGATSASFTIASATVANAGSYTVSVSNGSGGSVASTGAVLAVDATGAPAISVQPQAQLVAEGSSVAFSVSTSGTITVSAAPDRGLHPEASSTTYQWYFNGAALSGGTGSTLLVPNASQVNEGSYSCLVSNASGSTLSSSVTLSVTTTSDPGHIVNISCRALSQTGANQLIAGYVIGGAGTSGSLPVLIRASGPALAPFGVSGVLSDPKLTFNSGASVIATDAGWAGNAQVAAAASAVGAFPWSSTSSLDSALVESLGEGAYTAEVAGVSGDSGVALAEVYDTTPPGSYTVSSPRLINISARVQVGTGGNILIAGFVIDGATAKTVLIRGSGPALTAFGVGGVLPDPQLSLYRNNADGSATLVQSNTGWAGSTQVASTAASVGAFSWGTSATPDSALLVTLAPGAYTAQVSGASGDTGVALVEVYDVP